MADGVINTSNMNPHSDEHRNATRHNHRVIGEQRQRELDAERKNNGTR